MASISPYATPTQRALKLLNSLSPSSRGPDDDAP
jgi:hypothetical protein